VDCSVEIALITTASHSPSLIYEPYRPMKMVAFASVKHPLAAKRKLTLAELSQAPLIVKTKEAVPGRVSKIGEFLEEIEKRGLKPNIFMYCDSPQAVKAAVKTGIGVGLLYEMSLEAEIRAGELKILNVPEVKICMESSIIYRKDRALSPNTQDFLTLLREWPQKVKLLKGSLRVA
jgi:LysR family cys regulon transcriptional activator